MKVGVIGAGTMGQGIAKAFAQVDGYEVALCDIKQEWAEGGKDKIAKGYARLVEKGKMTQEAVDGILAKITPGLKEDLCADCDLIVEAAFENMEVKKSTFGELDKIARDVIENAGYGEYFGHSLGHGVGMEIHEAPTASPKSDEILQENSIITVEPGIYIPDKFGVRIEDMARITRNGCENLTKSPKELIIL